MAQTCRILSFGLELRLFVKRSFLSSHQDFIDLTLSKTQRKTPTVIHKNYQINRIRHFYMRKIKFTQQNYHDRLSEILTDFPKLDVSHLLLWEVLNLAYLCYMLFLSADTNTFQLIPNKL